jgi:hypothetical protein
VALGVKKGTFTWPTSTGTFDLAGTLSFVPKAVHLWTTGGQTSAGAVTNQSTRWSQGFGTYRGAAVQQCYTSNWATDGNTSAIYGQDTDDNAILTRMASDTTRDAVITLDSMDSDSVTLNCTDASASAVIVHYLVLGGDDISDAEAHFYRFGTSSPQDVTLGSGFGNPGDSGDPFLWFFAQSGVTASGGGISGIDWNNGFGVTRSDSERAFCLFGGDDGGGNMNVAIWAKDRALLGFTSAAGTADAEGDLNTSGHPTDGYELTWPDVPSLQRTVCALAIRGTFQAQIGRQATRTSTGDQDIAQSFSEELRACIFFGHSEPGSTSPITSGTSLGNIFVGATDLTTEGSSGFGDDDGLGFNNSALITSTTQAVQCYGHTGTENSITNLYSADVAENSTNVRLTYTTANGTAREFAYCFLYDASAGGTTFDQDVTANATSTATIQRQANKLVTANASSTATIQRLVSKALTATSTTTATVRKQVNKALTATTVTTTATINTVKVKIQALTATVTSTATMQRQVSKLVNATVTTLATVRKQISKALTATASSTATIATIKVKLQALTATVTSSATIQRQTNKLLNATATTLATIQKQVAKRITATVATTATIQALRVFLRTLTATVTTTATIRRSVSFTLSAAVTTTASVAKTIPKTLVATATSLASMIADWIPASFAALPPFRSTQFGRLRTRHRGSVAGSELGSLESEEAGTITTAQTGTLGEDTDG